MIAWTLDTLVTQGLDEAIKMEKTTFRWFKSDLEKDDSKEYYKKMDEKRLLVKKFNLKSLVLSLADAHDRS